MLPPTLPNPTLLYYPYPGRCRGRRGRFDGARRVGSDAGLVFQATPTVRGDDYNVWRGRRRRIVLRYPEGGCRVSVWDTKS